MRRYALAAKLVISIILHTERMGVSRDPLGRSVHFISRRSWAGLGWSALLTIQLIFLLSHELIIFMIIS